ncbi:MAG TPA: hypothetical protein ACFCUY_16050 [Xenococcaceae cyanobacterium]
MTWDSVPDGDRRWQFWYLLTMMFALSYGLMALQEAFDGQWVVQDDARQHVFWMMRYLDSDLFPNDLIANYFESVAPVGYKTVYFLATKLGVSPLIFNKLLPPILGLVASRYGFFLIRQIFPIPIGCFISTLLLNQILWLKDDIISGTPRAFAYPLFLAFLYYLSKRSLFPCTVTIALLGIFYPQCVFLASGMLLMQLIQWRGITPYLSQNTNDYFFGFVGLGVAFSVMLPYALHVSEYAPTITRAEALALPEFQPGGRSAFFKSSFWGYIFDGGRSGLLPRSLYTPVTVIFGFFLPLIIRFPRKLPLVKQVTQQVAILPQLIVVSVVMFLLAHALLFKLHLPGRYTGLSFRIVIALAAGIVLTAILQALQQQIIASSWSKKLFNIVLIGIITISVVAYPSFVDRFPSTKYKEGKADALYQFLQQQPQDTLIASLTSEADNLPTFTQRSILASREYAIPYHLGYYGPYRQRVADLIQAQYSTDPEVVKSFIRHYDITHWLIEATSFTPGYISENNWILQHQPEAQAALENLQTKETSALATYQDKCSVFNDTRYQILSTDCILEEDRKILDS